MTYCSHGARHWFAYYGMVGSSAPACRRCGAKNPDYRPADDPFRDLSEPDVSEQEARTITDIGDPNFDNPRHPRSRYYEPPEPDVSEEAGR
jgi:hypothetical protein